jgi:hypothetical protein
MTSTRRTNLFRINSIEDVALPVLSVGLTDLSATTVQSFAEVRDDFRVVGNGTFKPSFGEGVASHQLSNEFRTLFTTFLHGHAEYTLQNSRPCHHRRIAYIHL